MCLVIVLASPSYALSYSQLLRNYALTYLPLSHAALELTS